MYRYAFTVLIRLLQFRLPAIVLEMTLDVASMLLTTSNIDINCCTTDDSSCKMCKSAQHASCCVCVTDVRCSKVNLGIQALQSSAVLHQE